MPYSDAQLTGWTQQGAVQASATAYASIKRAIEQWPALRNRYVDIYLQGSYRNHTNIRGESDVDVVVHCPESFFWDVDQLVEPTKSRKQAEVVALPEAAYGWVAFRGDVLDALTNYYGAAKVANGNKCINVNDPGGSRIDADVVPCFTHKRYTHAGITIGDDLGIAFLTEREKRRVVNFPKQHIANGEAKNTDQPNYKPVVRMFKNIKVDLVERAVISESVAPSYFIECMLYNVPNRFFSGTTWTDVFVSTIKGLDFQFRDYMCGNGIIPLFGDSPEQWSRDDAITYLSAVMDAATK